MDRGRQGGFVTDNNYVMVKFHEKKRREHLARLEKIKHRKPGTSHTLDNSPPVVVKAALTNPRKVALKDTFNFITEQENKSLLKRISSILVAPPKVTDKEYLEMKKLCPSSFKSPKMAFEEALVEKKNREFFENLKKTKPYYNPKDWEEDYKKQLFNQKFMRQVKYKRPPDFVDPLLSKLESPEDKNKETAHTRSTTSRDTKEPRSKSTASHVRRVRAQRTISNRRQQPVAHTSNGSAQDEENYDDADFMEVVGSQHSKHSREFADDFDYDHDSFFGDDDASSAREEVRVSLARTQRPVRLTRDDMVIESPPDPNDPNFFFTADVDCWLSNGESIIVRVVGEDGEQSVNAEAEIRKADLQMLVELPPNEKLDPKDMAELAQQIVENVEVHLEQSVYRLILNLMTENDQYDANSASVTDWDTALPAICASEEELQTMLLQDNHEHVLSTGFRIPVHFQVHSSVHGISNFSSLVDVATLSAKVEYVFTLVKFFSTKEDQLFVKVFIVNNILSSFRKGLRTRPAVASEEILTITVPLPSVVLADPEIVIAFAENLTRSLRIEHDCKSGENKLLVLSS